MMGKIAPPRVILVTDPAFGDEMIVRCVRLVAAAMPDRSLCVQLRDKRRPRISLRPFAAQLRQLTRAVGASLIVNGDPRVARDVGADGVHLGRDAGPLHGVREICGERAWISVAAHSDQAVRAAVDAGADAVLVSPVFTTRAPSVLGPVKHGRGIEALRAARSIVAGSRVAVYALGGVTAGNARACVRGGADGIAVIRALLGSAQPDRVARALHDAVGARC
jgi:thiamine-phosphate pyrophosphorylase